MKTLYEEIVYIFAMNPQYLYGFTLINFSEYKDIYKSALVYAIPHIKIVDIENYNEETLDHYINQACKEINYLQNEIEEILLKYSIKYIFPQIIQRNEQDLSAPISFKQLGIDAGIGWIGKNDLLVTNEYGPRVRLGAVLMDYDFSIDLFNNQLSKSIIVNKTAN
jgi:epoxyqueuosine reductase QueG